MYRCCFSKPCCPKTCWWTSSCRPGSSCAGRSTSLRRWWRTAAWPPATQPWHSPASSSSICSMLSPVGKVFIYVTVTYGTLKFFCRLNPKLLIAIWITVQIKSGSFILLNKIKYVFFWIILYKVPQIAWLIFFMHYTYKRKATKSTFER